MRSLLKFIYKYHFFILFIFLEIFAFVFLVRNNNYQRAAFLNSSSNLSGSVYALAHNVSQYFHLKETNEKLVSQLVSINNLNKVNYKDNRVTLIEMYDSVYVQRYQYIPAKVINNSVNRQNNYLTLNKGRKQGLEAGMAVVSLNGVVGIIKESSENFSSVVSLLNQNLMVSAMVMKNGYFGTLQWEGFDYRTAILRDLPNHIHLEKGDTIITSGYSSIFPKGEVIGVVDEVSKRESGDFYNVDVLLSEDFKKLSEVFVIKNLMKKEQLELERRANHD